MSYVLPRLVPMFDAPADAGTGAPAAAPAATATPAATAPPATPATAPAATPAPAATGPAVGLDGQPFDADRANALITKLREENKSSAAASKTLAAILRAAGVSKDSPTEPAELQQALADERAARAASDAALSAFKFDASLDRAIAKAGGKADVLAPYIKSALSSTDPSAEGFEKELSSKIDAAIKAYPEFKVTQAVTTSGTPIPGGSGGTNPITRDQLRTMSADEIVRLQAEGQLTHLGYGKTA